VKYNVVKESLTEQQKEIIEIAKSLGISPERIKFVDEEEFENIQLLNIEKMND
jgi:hypothetical protein